MHSLRLDWHGLMWRVPAIVASCHRPTRQCKCQVLTTEPLANPCTSLVAPLSYLQNSLKNARFARALHFAHTVAHSLAQKTKIYEKEKYACGMKSHGSCVDSNPFLPRVRQRGILALLSLSNIRYFFPSPATSSGTHRGLKNRAGGLCKHGNLRVMFRVCCKQEFGKSIIYLSPWM